MFKLFSSPYASVRKVLYKLIISFFVFIISIAVYLCKYDLNHINSILMLVATIFFILTVLLSRDASKTLRREMPNDKMAKKIALVLSIPQIALGIVFLAIGVVMPFVALYGVIKDIQSGQPFFPHFLNIISAFMSIIIGYYIVYEGLGFIEQKRRR